MGRPTAFTDAQFIKALPNTESESITCSAISELVGCSRAKANDWLLKNVNSGRVALGPAAKSGAHTYYAVTIRPDNWLPRIADAGGVNRDIKAWVKANIDGRDNPGPVGRPLVLAILNTWVNACSDTVKFNEANQEERVKLLGYRAGLRDVLRSIDSFLNDPFLSGNNDEVSMAENAIRAVSADIDLDEVINRYNALRSLG